VSLAWEPREHAFCLTPLVEALFHAARGAMGVRASDRRLLTTRTAGAYLCRHFSRLLSAPASRAAAMSGQSAGVNTPGAMDGPNQAKTTAFRPQSPLLDCRDRKIVDPSWRNGRAQVSALQDCRPEPDVERSSALWPKPDKISGQSKD